MGKNIADNGIGSIKTGDIRLGIIGTGRIASQFVKETVDMPGLVPAAVFNVHKSSAERFAEEHGIPKATEDLCTFMNDVDAVYIASPHETHGDYSRVALEYGKHVLCEKPLSLNREEAEKLFYLANQKNLVLMEAIKTTFCEGFQKMIEEAESGSIGEIHDIDVSFIKPGTPGAREFTDTRYGGSFLELGSYNLLPIFRLYGTDYEKVVLQSVYAENGIDIFTKATFDFGEGRYATAKTGLGITTEAQIVITGSKGYILAEAPWWHTDHYQVHGADPTVSESYSYLYEGNGLLYEGAAFAARIRGEKGSDPEREEKEALARAAIMEQFIRENRNRRKKERNERLAKAQ